MRSISLKLPEALDRRVTELAERRKTTKSEIIRLALEAFADRSTSSVRALAADLAGSVEGPRDLSTSKRHLAGYGR